MTRKSAAWAASSVLVAVALLAAPAVASARTGTSMSSSISKHRVGYSAPATLQGRLQTSSGAALAGQAITLTRNGAKSGTLRTDRHGRVSVAVKSLRSSTWRFAYSGARRLAGSTSPGQHTSAQLLVDDSIPGEYPRVTSPLAGGRTYQVMTDVPVMWFVGQVPNYDSQLAKDTNQTRSFTYRAPSSATYWIMWDGFSGPGVHATIW